MAFRSLSGQVTPPAGLLTTRRVDNTPSGPEPKDVKEGLNLLPNVYMTQGISNPFHVSILDEDSIRIRIDMPGVSPERLKISAENNRIHFSGSEDPAKMHGIKHYTPRTYSGAFDLDPNRFRAEDHVSHLVNGVLFFLFTCIRPKPVVFRYPAFALHLGYGEKIEGNKQIYNQFTEKGKDLPFKFEFRDDAFVLVVDMPGVSNGDHTLTVEGGNVSFRAEADLNELHSFKMEAEPKSIRVYQVLLEIELEAYEAENAKAVAECGVLLIQVPRRFRQPTSPGSSNLFSKGQIFLHMGMTKVALQLYG